MSMKILSVALLLLLVCPCFQFAGNMRHVKKWRPSPPCCVKVSSVNVSSEVIGLTYRQHSAQSPCVDAIIFTTALGPVCVEPKAKWVQRLKANMTKL